MKIVDLRIRYVKYEVTQPFTNSMGTSFCKKTGRTGILEVFTDEGITGVLGSHFIDDLCRQIVTDHLKQLVVGEDPMNYARVWQKMFGIEGQWRPQIAKGEVVRAISMVDTAIWDIIGKALNTPVYKLLGGFRDQVPCYASGGHYVAFDSQIEELRHLEAEMALYMDMGFKAVKMRAGRDIPKDEERVKLVREIIGPDVQLMVDFNTSQTYKGGVAQAIKFCRALEKYDIYWFEDLVVMDDLTGLKQISDAIDSAIATGEYEQTIWGFRDLIVNKAADIILPDATQVCGGITEWRRIAALADAYRIPIAAHIGDMTHVHCVAAVPNGLIVEYFRPQDTTRRMYEAEPLAPNKDGMFDVPQTPGFGMELNEGYIRTNLTA